VTPPVSDRIVSRPPVTTLLPPAAGEFFAISDTHLVDTSSPHATEFASRLMQNDRIDAVFSVVAGYGADVVHLGDLVQEYPGSAQHADLLRRAVAQLRATGVESVCAPGNTDIGDPHDPASPADPVTESAVAGFTAAVGYPWTAVEVAGLRVILLAASVLNSGLDSERRQWEWLDQELTAAAGRRMVLGLHYPLFLRSPQDPDVGHYDVINEPARSRLIELIERHGVELVLTGHSHFQFFNRIGAARAHVLPSTSFTRPGFSEMFSSAAPPDRGRNDLPKLGCMLVRVHPDDLRLHRVRTATLVDRPTARPVLSCVPKDLPGSRLGVTLHHPLATFAEVPDTFPSVIRQPVRNDYPLLSCLELGAGRVSVSQADLADPRIGQRLRVLRDEGVAVVVRLLWPKGRPPAEPAPNAPVDEVELVLLDRTALTAHEAADVAAWSRPLLLSSLTKLPKGAAELPRWKYGVSSPDAHVLDTVLAAAGRSGDRVLVAGTPSLDGPDGWTSLAGADHVLAAPGTSEHELSAFAADLLRALARSDVRAWIDGLTEFDRTLVAAPGLLDRMCNPRPGFHVARLLTSTLQSDPDAVVEVSRDGRRARVASSRFHAVIEVAGQLAGAGELIDLAIGETARAVPPGSPAMLLRPADA
jgi:hypothetical protein